MGNMMINRLSCSDNHIDNPYNLSCIVLHHIWLQATSLRCMSSACGLRSLLQAVRKKKNIGWIDTVDGRNSAPPSMVETL